MLTRRDADDVREDRAVALRREALVYRRAAEDPRGYLSPRAARRIRERQLEQAAALEAQAVAVFPETLISSIRDLERRNTLEV